MPVVTQYFTKNPGLGDHIRGAVWLRRVAAEYGYEYRPNFTLHPAAPFIDAAGSDTSDPPEPLDEYFIHTMGLRVASCLIRQMMESQQDIRIACNIGAIATPITPLLLTSEDKDFIKSLVRPTQEMADRVEDMAASVRASQRTMYHFRLHDSLEPCEPEAGLVDFLSECIEDDGSVVFSDNQLLKNAIAAKRRVLLMTEAAEHFGRATDESQVRDGMTEFFLIGRFGSIVSHSAYPWASNFLSYKAAAHDVPLEAHCFKKDTTDAWILEDNGTSVRSIAAQHNG